MTGSAQRPSRLLATLICLLACSSGGDNVPSTRDASVAADSSGGGGRDGESSGGDAPLCVPNGWAEKGVSSIGGGGIGGAPVCVDPVCPRPVCGSDRQVYSSDCAAHAAGEAPGYPVSCTPPPGFFQCGERFCRTGTEFCARMTGALGGGRCVGIPATCATTPSCGCIPLQQSCGQCTCNQCQASPTGDITLSCSIA